MKVLISLLGRVRSTGPGGYETVEYEFEDGDRARAGFLGWPLARRLNPDRLIIIGTATSMWDHLFEGDLDLADQAEERRLELIRLVDQGQPVPEDLLQAMEPALADILGCQHHLPIVDAAHQLIGIASSGDLLPLQSPHPLRLVRDIQCADSRARGDRLARMCHQGSRHQELIGTR